MTVGVLPRFNDVALRSIDFISMRVAVSRSTGRSISSSVSSTGTTCLSRLKRVTEVTDGLYQYQAEYESTEIIEARLREQEVEKQLDIHATAYIDLIQEHDQRPVTDTP